MDALEPTWRWKGTDDSERNSASSQPVAAGVPAPGVVVIAGSAGAISVLNVLLPNLPANLAAAVLIVQHRSPKRPSFLVEVLRLKASLFTKEAEEGELVRSGTIYVAPPDRHMTVTTGRTIQLVEGPRILNFLSSANPLFESAAAVYGERTVGIVLSGLGSDARDGALAIVAAGGIVIAQDPATARAPSMPRAAMSAGAAKAALPVELMAGEIARLVRGWKGDR
jgi:two-component system, chemotaxis family, protein-glutamate methylesterase/glutaminase